MYVCQFTLLFLALVFSLVTFRVTRKPRLRDSKSLQRPVIIMTGIIVVISSHETDIHGKLVIKRT